MMVNVLRTICARFPRPTVSTGKRTDRFAQAGTRSRPESARSTVPYSGSQADAAYIALEPLRVVTVEQVGTRSILGVPMLTEGQPVGVFVIYCQEVRPFTESRLTCSRLSPTRPSSPSRICGCSTRCASAPQTFRITRAADRDVGSAECHFQLGDGRPAGVRHDCRQRSETVRGPILLCLSV